MEKSKVTVSTALMNVYARKSITIAVALIALFCLSGCVNVGWTSSTDLIPDRDAVNPFESAKYILFRPDSAKDILSRPDNSTDSDNPKPGALLQRKSGKHEIFATFNPSDPSALLVKFYNIGGYFGPKKYIWGVCPSNNLCAYWYVTENKLYMPILEGDSSVNSISEIKESINSGIKFDFMGELRAISSIQAAQLRQEMIAYKYRAGRVFRDALKDGGEGPQMVVLPTGSFRMGSPAGEVGRYSDEGPVRTVTISKRIAMGRYEVTFAEYDRFAEATSRTKPDDNGLGRGSRPVINVNWNEAKAYATWLSAQTGTTYRLPSEAEWEYAARAGKSTRYSWGDEINCNQARYGRREGGECSSTWDGTVAVGSFAANAFGLFDMHGNAWEWVEDCYVDSYAGAPSDGSARRRGCGSDVRAVVRGGSWNNNPRSLRSAFRTGLSPSFRYVTFGFRLVQDLNP